MMYFSSKATNSDLLDSRHFLKRRFTVLTAFSALPLDCGYRGDDVTCSKCHCFANFVNSSDENWGPLSETTVSGTPYRANKDFRAFVTLPEVVLLRFSTSM